MTYVGEEVAYPYPYLAPAPALDHSSPHEEEAESKKATYMGEEVAYPSPSPYPYLARALNHGSPHDGSNHHPYLVHDQKLVVEIDDVLYPLSYAETSRLIENHPFFLLVLG